VREPSRAVCNLEQELGELSDAAKEPGLNVHLQQEVCPSPSTPNSDSPGSGPQLLLLLTVKP
jgi:hypothetical protein